MLLGYFSVRGGVGMLVVVESNCNECCLRVVGFCLFAGSGAVVESIRGAVGWWRWLDGAVLSFAGFFWGVCLFAGRWGVGGG